MKLPSALLPVLLLGCSTPSQLTLTVFVDDEALQQVATFPTVVTIDFDNEDGEVLTIDLCEWNGADDFLTVELEPQTYKGCRSATTVRGVLSETTSICDNGRIETPKGELPPEEEWIGYGERVVFDSQTCGVIQESTLAIDPF